MADTPPYVLCFHGALVSCHWTDDHKDRRTQNTARQDENRMAVRWQWPCCMAVLGGDAEHMSVPSISSQSELSPIIPLEWNLSSFKAHIHVIFSTDRKASPNHQARALVGAVRMESCGWLPFAMSLTIMQTGTQCSGVSAACFSLKHEETTERFKNTRRNHAGTGEKQDPPFSASHLQPAMPEGRGGCTQPSLSGQARLHALSCQH